MNFNTGLKLYETIDNNRLTSIFQCSTQGGMRRAKATNSLVLVSNHIKSIYDDRWVDDIFLYTGMGTKGDQSLEFMQNKTLAESGHNGVEVYLFEVFQEKVYTYMGPVVLADKPYQEEQPGEDGKLRNVWVFPLKAVNENVSTSPINKTTLESLYEKKIKEAKRLTTEQLEQRVKSVSKRSGQRNTTVTQYERSPWISEYAKRRANGICQLCLEPAPFENKKGEPYLETHHIIWLSKDGEDSIENTVALCPNCHRKMHVLNDNSDVDVLIKRTLKN